MNIDLSKLWAQAQDLNFGQITEVLNAAVQAAEDKIHEIRKDNITGAGMRFWHDTRNKMLFRWNGKAVHYWGQDTRWANQCWTRSQCEGPDQLVNDKEITVAQAKALVEEGVV